MGVGAICEYDPATAFFIALVFFNVFALGRTLRFRSVFLNMSVTSLSVLFSTLSIKPEVCEGFVRKKAGSILKASLTDWCDNITGGAINRNTR